jgi:hypothetical protein
MAPNQETMMGLKVVVDTTGEPFPEIRITWYSEAHQQDLTYHVLLQIKEGRASEPGLGLSPPLVYHDMAYRSPVEVALARWRADGKPDRVAYDLGGPESYTIRPGTGWVGVVKLRGGT